MNLVNAIMALLLVYLVWDKIDPKGLEAAIAKVKQFPTTGNPSEASPLTINESFRLAGKKNLLAVSQGKQIYVQIDPARGYAIAIDFKGVKPIIAIVKLNGGTCTTMAQLTYDPISGLFSAKTSNVGSVSKGGVTTFAPPSNGQGNLIPKAKT